MHGVRLAIGLTPACWRAHPARGRGDRRTASIGVIKGSRCCGSPAASSANIEVPGAAGRGGRGVDRGGDVVDARHARPSRVDVMEALRTE
jgi:hypothetical protein